MKSISIFPTVWCFFFKLLTFKRLCKKHSRSCHRKHREITRRRCEIKLVTWNQTFDPCFAPGLIPDIHVLLELHLILVPVSLQLTKTTNRCHISPSARGECVQSQGAPVTMSPLCSSGCQPARRALVYGFPSNLHLTFRVTAFSFTFPPPNDFLWGDYLWAAAAAHWFRWRDTHTHTQNMIRWVALLQACVPINWQKINKNCINCGTGIQEIQIPY